MSLPSSRSSSVINYGGDSDNNGASSECESEASDYMNEERQEAPTPMGESEWQNLEQAVNRLAEASRESLAMELRRFQNVERAYDRFNDAYRALRIQMTESRRTADESIQTFANMVSLVLREMTLNVAVERMEAIIGILFDEGVECDHCANMRSG